VSYRVPPEPGGKERHVGCLTAAQLHQGHDVTVAFRHGVQPAGTTELALPATAGSRLLSARSDVLAFAAQVATALRATPRFDLVHLHGDHVEALLLGPACRRLRLPLFLTVHGALADRHHRLAGWALGHVDAVMALGVRPAADLMRRGVDRNRIRVACSGLDLPALSRFRTAEAREPGLVVSVGSLDAVKNHELLINAWHRLPANGRGGRLVIVGDGPDGARLRRLAEGVAGVHLVGALARDEVYRLVASAEIFVLASRHLVGKGEGVPTAALEALALGTAVVLSSAATLEPVVPPGQVYRLFESESVTDLVRVLGEVADDAAARRRMMALGPPAVGGLGWDAVAARVEEWYRTSLRVSPGRSGGSGRAAISRS